MRGPSSSDSRATATSAVAISASSTGRRPLAASGRAREEDHALGVTRDVRERPDHLRLAPAARVGRRHGRPQAGVKLAAELAHQALLVLAAVALSLGDQDLSVTGLHPKEAHPMIMSLGGRATTRPGADGRAPPGPSAAGAGLGRPARAAASGGRLSGDLDAPAAAPGDPQHVHGAGAAAD